MHIYSRHWLYPTQPPPRLYVVWSVFLVSFISVRGNEMHVFFKVIQVVRRVTNLYRKITTYICKPSSPYDTIYP